MRTLFSLLALAAGTTGVRSASDAQVIQQFFTAALTGSPAYDQLKTLTSDYPGRLSGSSPLAGAVTWSEHVLGEMELDRVWTQEVAVPHWERGAPESVQLVHADGTLIPLAALALGNSGATPSTGVTARILEVDSLATLEALGRERVAGRIVFFNRPMESALVNAGLAYGRAGDQRNRGPALAARLGAVGAVVRSLTHALDDTPHTGYTGFPPGIQPIPALALSTRAANTLADALAVEPGLQLALTTHCRALPDAVSHNVIGEIRGSEFPDQVILVGGHLDSWDIAPGAHDDGTGVVQSIEVLRLFRTLDLKPRHTLRCVLFTNEESGLRGATAYATHAKANGEKHVFAVETDTGGFAPRGFTFGSTQGDAHERAARWRPLLEPYGLHVFEKGGGGADVAPLLLQGTAVGNLVPDSQRYFDYHHTAADSLDKVNKRELELGAAALAALIYLVDTQGL